MSVNLDLTFCLQQIFSVQGIPKCLLAIVDKEYSLVIQIKEINIVKSFKFYWATNICTGFVSLPVIPTDGASSSQAQTSQVRLFIANCNRNA